MRSELPVGTKYVAILTHSLREIEDNGFCEEVKLFGQSDQRFPCFWLDVGCINNREPSACEPLTHDLMQKIEGVSGSRLVVFVIGDKCSAEVRRDDLRGKKVLPSERRLAGTGGADQKHERQ